MRITRRFRYAEDPESGLKGLLPVWLPQANPTLEVAHDMLEHGVDRDKSAVEGELMALGAVLALRIENDALGSGSALSHERQLGGLVLQVLEDIDRYDLAVPRACRSRPLDSCYDWANELIDAAVPAAFKDRQEELTKYEKQEPTAWLKDPQSRDTVKAWLRKGYRRALRRYDGLDLYTLGACTFKRLDEFSRRMASSEMLAQGDVVSLSVNVRTLALSARVNGRPWDQ